MTTLLALIAIASPASQKTTIQFEAVVNPGMELIGIYLWMSNRYPPPSDSTYKFEVWRHFEKFRGHESLLATRGIKVSFPDYTEMGLLLEREPTPRFKAPQSTSWYNTYGKATVGDLNDAILRFAKASGFWAFYDKQLPEYNRWCREFEGFVAKDQTLEKLDRFYRYDSARPRPKVTICLEPLNSWGAHAILFKRLSGEDEGNRVTFQLGFMSRSYPDTKVTFTNSRSIIPTVWHEGSHVYVAPLAHKYGDRIDKLSRLFNEERLRSQEISTWRYCFEENVVRAIVANLVRLHDGEGAYLAEVRNQTKGNGFIYTYQIAEKIWNEYVKKPDQHKDFEAFFPEILKLLEGLKAPEDATLPG